jgi:DNA primase
MGSSMSRVQYDIIARLGGSKVMFYDNDRAGIEGTLRIGKWLSKIGSVKCVVLFPWAKQPDDLNRNGLGTVVNNRVRFHKWKRQTQMVVDVFEVT